MLPAHLIIWVLSGGFLILLALVTKKFVGKMVPQAVSNTDQPLIRNALFRRKAEVGIGVAIILFLFDAVSGFQSGGAVWMMRIIYLLLLILSLHNKYYI